MQLDLWTTYRGERTMEGGLFEDAEGHLLFISFFPSITPSVSTFCETIHCDINLEYVISFPFLRFIIIVAVLSSR